jgi:hypothetical protein
VKPGKEKSGGGKKKSKPSRKVDNSSVSWAEWTAHSKCPECKQRIKKSEKKVHCSFHGVLVHYVCCCDSAGNTPEASKFLTDDPERFCNDKCVPKK